MALAGRGAHGGVGARPGPVLRPRPVHGVRAGRAQSPGLAVASIGGMHNDAIMLGLLVARPGPRPARPSRRSGSCCAPWARWSRSRALLGVVFIGWEWAGASARRRVGAPGTSSGRSASALAVMAVVSEASGLGWAWLVEPLGPRKGELVARSRHRRVGLGDLPPRCTSSGPARTPTRWSRRRGAVALLVAGGDRVRPAGQPDRRYGMPRALGWSLLAVVFLGPIVWPWYETWGLVFLALAGRRVVAPGRRSCSRRWRASPPSPPTCTATTADVVVAVARAGSWWRGGGLGAAPRPATPAAVSGRDRVVPTVDPMLGTGWMAG